MKKLRILSLLFAFAILASCNCNTNAVQEEPSIPSWNETPLKQEIINFAKSVSDENSENFVPQTDRIAVFDNDGTLWNEKPLYIPIEYEISYVKEIVAKNPQLKSNKLLKGLAEDNLAIMKEYTTLQLIHELFSNHDKQIESDYKASVYSFLSNEKHKKYNRPFKELTYQPMVELVHFLQAYNFKVYIVTGGEISFVRTVSEEIYQIPIENVIGSNVKYKYTSDSKGSVISRTNELASANDKHVKPCNIELHIGKKPIFAAGNSDGDYEMMEYTLSGSGPSMAILVNHDDDEREYNYMHGTEKAVADAEEKGWYVISMKSEFKTIFQQ